MIEGEMLSCPFWACLVVKFKSSSGDADYPCPRPAPCMTHKTSKYRVEHHCHLRWAAYVMPGDDSFLCKIYQYSLIKVSSFLLYFNHGGCDTVSCHGALIQRMGRSHNTYFACTQADFQSWLIFLTWTRCRRSKLADRHPEGSGPCHSPSCLCTDPGPS